MSNWTSITVDNLKASGYGFIVDQARGKSVGGVDPAVECIADAVNRIRRAVAAGNFLDTDQTKVPNSLRDVAVRIAFYALKMRLGVSLSEDERAQKRSDDSDLLRIADTKVRVEVPDNPNGENPMQSAPVPAITPRRRHFTAWNEEGA
jgi:hypothetical protein